MGNDVEELDWLSEYGFVNLSFYQRKLYVKFCLIAFFFWRHFHFEECFLSFLKEPLNFKHSRSINHSTMQMNIWKQKGNPDFWFSDHLEPVSQVYQTRDLRPMSTNSVHVCNPSSLSSTAGDVYICPRVYEVLVHAELVRLFHLFTLF